MIYQPFVTPDSNLAAALLTLGIPPYAAKPVERLVEGGKETVYWAFDSGAVGANGMTAEQIGKHWEFQKLKDHEMANPEDPLCYVRIFAHNKERLIDVVKQYKRVHVKRQGKKTYLVTE